MPFADLVTVPILLSHSGDTWRMPFDADASGTWSLVLDDDSTEDFEVIEGLTVALPDDLFTNKAVNIYKVLREDGALFNNRAYSTFIDYEVFTESTENTISTVGKIHFVTDADTKSSYTNPAFIGLKEYFVIWENQLIYPDYAIDPVSKVGTFTWTLEEDQNVFILFFK